MQEFYVRSRRLPFFLAADFLLLSIWTLLRRLIPLLTGAQQTAQQAPSYVSCALFALAPFLLYALSARASKNNAKTAFYAGAVSHFLSLAAYVLSLSGGQGVRLLPLILCLSLGAAILQAASFGLCAAALKGHRAECAASLAAAFVCLVEQAAYLTALYIGMKLTGAGYAPRLLQALAAASTVQFFAAIVKGCVCAMVFLLLFLAVRERAGTDGETDGSATSEEE